MFGIARSRRQACSASPCRSARPLATSWAARRSAMARLATRPHDSISAGARPGQPGGRGRVAQGPAGAAAAEAVDQPPLDLDRALAVDQLLADRPGERLEGLGAAARPQPGAAADHGPDQPVALEGGVELGEVVVEPEREVHALEPVARRRPARWPPPGSGPLLPPARPGPITGSSPWWRRRRSTPSRRRSSPSRPAPGSR